MKLLVALNNPDVLIQGDEGSKGWPRDQKHK